MKKPHRKTDARVTDTVGDLADGQGPVRQCAVTRERCPTTDLLRFVLSPDDVVVLDVAGKLPGRGVWLRADKAVLDKAVKTGAFKRGFKTASLTLPADLAGQAEDLLAQRAVAIIGMAKKAGDLVLGFDQVRDALKKSAPGILLEACDGAEDGRSKLYFLAKALYSGVEVAGALTSMELGMAIGRDRVIHGLVRPGPVAESFKLAYRRLCGFRIRPELDWFPDQDR